MAIIVYEKSTCTSCRALSDLLVERGIDFDTVEFQVEGLTEAEISDLLAKAGIGARDALRVKEPGAESLENSTDEEIIAAMVAEPALLQRPMVVNGDRAVLARPVERVLEIL